MSFGSWVKERWHGLINGADWMAFALLMAASFGLCATTYSNGCPGLGTFFLFLGLLSVPPFIVQFVKYVGKMMAEVGGTDDRRGVRW